MRALVALLLTLATGCVLAGTTGPELLPTPRPNTVVAATFNKTWNTVIDVFSDKNIPIGVIDRSSGLIGTQELWISSSDSSEKWADCGKDAHGEPFAPAFAVYNIVVRGDTGGTTVRTTVKWYGRQSATGPVSGYDCVSRGVWENNMDASVKARAEGRPMPVATVSPPTPQSPVCNPGEEHSASRGHDFCWRNVGGIYQWVEVKRKDAGGNP